MPDIYDIDFNLQSDQLNNPPRRMPKIKAFLHSLMYPLQWIRDLFFNDYVNGMQYPAYSKIILYNIGNRITYGNRSNYECIQPALNISPLNTDYWIKIQDVYLGMYERSHYNAQKIMLERVLNTYFNTTPTTAPLIYITNWPSLASPWTAFPSGSGNTTNVYKGSANQTKYVFPAAYAATANCFTIYCPLALANALTGETPNVVPNISTNRANIIRSLVDKYNTASVGYNIVTF